MSNLIHWMPFCSGGLCDRILGLIGTLCIAKTINCPFMIKWDHIPLNSAFTINSKHNYYSYNIPYEYLELNDHDARPYFETTDIRTVWNTKNICIWSNQNLYYFFNKNTNNTCISEDVYLKNIHDSIYELFSTIFIFNNVIQDTIKSFPEINIGIHIRTHDNQIFDKEKSNLQIPYITNILNKIKNHIKSEHNGGTNIFIASDCNLSFKLAQEILKEYSVIQYEGPIVHSGTNEQAITKEGLDKVLIDLQLLGKCTSTLYIGWNTNFSRIGALINPKRDIYSYEHPSTNDIYKCDLLELCNYSSNNRWRM